MNFPMSIPWRRIAFAMFVASAAFASGHFVQSYSGPSAAVAANFASPSTMTQISPVAEPSATSHPKCDRSLLVEEGLAGMLSIHVSAPCQANKLITVAQGPLVADWTLDEFGTRYLSFTPIAEQHPISVTWSDGKTVEQDLPEFRSPPPFRAALNWLGPKFLTLNAQEFGAVGNAVGHIHAMQTASPERMERGSGGFLTVLGDGTGRQAEVYTFPTDHPKSDGVVRLTVSAPVTLRTCGRQAKAEAYQYDPFAGLRTTVVNVALPDCDSIGQTLVLKHLFRDLRLAAY